MLPAAKTLLEALNTTGFVDDFVVASKERVTSVANIGADGRDRCTSREFVTAAAADVTVDVVRVDIFFHGNDQGFGCENLAGHDQLTSFLSRSGLFGGSRRLKLIQGANGFLNDRVNGFGIGMRFLKLF